jgi:serine/threonine-protein kinase
MQIDFSLDVLDADASTPMKAFTATGDFFDPDCDKTDVPLPIGGNIEGEDGYACTGGDDCHLLVYSASLGKLFEMWRANIVGADFQGGCLAVWDTHKQYDDTLRGEQCTSADAAGFPISAMLFTADEVAAGHIDHAIRLIMPNDRISQSFVPPATHGTDTTGGPGAPSYGFHMRLKQSFDVDSLPSEGAKVVARAMQKYGMYHSDGGNIALTAASDRYTTAKWDGLLDPHDVAGLKVDDFEIIDHGAPMDVTNHCNR